MLRGHAYFRRFTCDALITMPVTAVDKPTANTEMPRYMNPHMAMMSAPNPMATPIIVMRKPMY